LLFKGSDVYFAVTPTTNNMQLTIKKKIGRDTHTFIVEGKNLHDLVMESKKLSFNNVENCGLCGSDNLVLDGRIAQNKFKYVDIKCLDCRGSLTFGRPQEDPDTFYLRKTDTGKKDENGRSIKKYDWKEFNINE
jgi:hypothetical protein